MLSLEEIQKLEYQPESPENWQKIIKAYEERYKNNPKDKETILRYMYVLWILCLEAPILGYIDFLSAKSSNVPSKDYFDRGKYSKILSNIYFSSWKLFKNDPDYLFIVGYMITFAVFDISKKNNLLDYDKAGSSMIKRAYKLQPDNIVYKLAYLGTLNNNKSYLEFKINNKDTINSELDKYFNNRGLLGDYFYRIYSYSHHDYDDYKKEFSNFSKK